MHNENLRPFIETREAFEGRLKSMQGLEFMVARDPIQEAAAAVSAGEQSKEPSNVWVVRKQNRIKRDGMIDDVHILATYFIVGDFVYMAPSVLSVVGRRMVCEMKPQGCIVMTIYLLRHHAAFYSYVARQGSSRCFKTAVIFTLAWPYLHAFGAEISRGRPVCTTEQGRHPGTGTEC